MHSVTPPASWRKGRCCTSQKRCAHVAELRRECLRGRSSLFSLLTLSGDVQTNSRGLKLDDFVDMYTTRTKALSTLLVKHCPKRKIQIRSHHILLQRLSRAEQRPVRAPEVRYRRIRTNDDRGVWLNESCNRFSKKMKAEHRRRTLVRKRQETSSSTNTDSQDASRK